MVSVCIATFNGERYILKQIKSILTQIGLHDEVVISDDGSTDATLGVLRALKEERLRIILNKGDKGPVGNFQNALYHAKGDIVFLADQDDEWLPGRYETHVRLHKEYELIISDAVVIDESGSIIFSSFFEERGSRAGLFRNVIKNSYIGCCMSFKRSILEKALPFPKSVHMHDWWIGLIAETHGTVFFCKEKFLNYTRHSSNVSQTLVARLPIIKQITNRLKLIYNLLRH